MLTSLPSNINKSLPPAPDKPNHVISGLVGRWCWWYNANDGGRNNSTFDRLHAMTSLDSRVRIDRSIELVFTSVALLSLSLSLSSYEYICMYVFKCAMDWRWVRAWLNLCSRQISAVRIVDEPACFVANDIRYLNCSWSLVWNAQSRGCCCCCCVRSPSRPYLSCILALCLDCLPVYLFYLYAACFA